MSDSGTVRLPATLRLLQLRCIEAHKAAHLYYFYTQNPGRTLIFCNAISVVQSLTDLLNMLKVPAFPLHGKMQQRQRLKNLDRFVADANGVIVATDVAARGLDVRSLPSHRPRDATTRAARARARSLRASLTSPRFLFFRSRRRSITSTTSYTSMFRRKRRRSSTGVGARRAPVARAPRSLSSRRWRSTASATFVKVRSSCLLFALFFSFFAHLLFSDRFRDACAALGADCDKEGRSSLMKFEVERKRMRAISVRVDLAVKLQKLQVTNNRAAAKRGWLEQMAKDADLAIDEEEDEEQTVDAKSERAHEMSHLRKELRRALKTPLDRIR
jgi:hypothetical protein